MIPLLLSALSPASLRPALRRSVERLCCWRLSEPLRLVNRALTCCEHILDPVISLFSNSCLVLCHVLLKHLAVPC